MTTARVKVKAGVPTVFREGLPPELTGWTGLAFNGRNPPEYKLIAPGGWETKTYARLERAIAEAERYLLSQPQPKAAEPAEQNALEAAIQVLEVRGFQWVLNGSHYNLASGRGGRQRQPATFTGLAAHQVIMMAEIERRAGLLGLVVGWSDQWAGRCWVEMWRGDTELTIVPVTMEDALALLSNEERAAAQQAQEPAAPAEAQQVEQPTPASRPSRPRAPALPPLLQARLEALGGRVAGAKPSPHGPHYIVEWRGDLKPPRLTRLDRLVREIEKMEAERAAAAAAEAPAPAMPAQEPEQAPAAAAPVEEAPQPALKDGRSRPIVPWICQIHERKNMWRVPRLERRCTLWATEQLVRSADLESGQPDSKGKGNVFCVPDDAAWARLMEASELMQSRLDDLADELRRIGSYKKRLAEAGGFGSAPNPLAPTVISSIDPDESMPTVVWRPGLKLLSHFDRRVIERHTPQMVSVQYSSMGNATSMTSQRDQFPCASDEVWARVEAVYQAAQEAAAAYEALFVQLGTYADAEADGRYKNRPRPAAPAPLFEVATPPAPGPVEVAIAAGDFAEAHRQASAAVELSRRDNPSVAEPAPTMQAQLPPGVEPPVPAGRLQQALEAQSARLKALGAPLPLETRFGCPPELPRMFMAPVGSIVPGRYQPRKIFDQVKLDDLAASIRQHGVLDPVKVIINEDGWLELVGGERRLRATLLANLLFIPVQICDYTLAQIAEISLMDNLQRDDLTPVEEAEALGKLKEVLGVSENQMAERLGKNRSYIRQRLQIAGASEPLRRALAEEKINFTQARLLAAGAPDHRAQVKALNKLLTDLGKGPVSEQQITNMAEEQQFKLSKAGLVKLGWSVVDQTSSHMGFRRPLVYSSADRPREWTGNDIYTTVRDQRGPAGQPIGGGLDAEGLRLLNLLPCYIDLEHAPWIRLTGTPPSELIIDKSAYVSPAEASRYVEAVIRPAVEEVRRQIEAIAGWSLRAGEGEQGFDIVSPIGRSCHCRRLRDLQERATQIVGGEPPAWMLETPKEEALSQSTRTTRCPCGECDRPTSHWHSGYQVHLCDHHMEIARSTARAIEAARQERVASLARQAAQALPAEVLELLAISTFDAYNPRVFGSPASAISPGEALTAMAQMDEQQLRALLVGQVVYGVCKTNSSYTFRPHLDRQFGLAQPTLDDLAQMDTAPAEPAPAAASDDAALSPIRARLDAVIVTLEQFGDSDDVGNPENVTVLRGCLDELGDIEKELASADGAEDLRELSQHVREQLDGLLGVHGGGDLGSVARRLQELQQWLDDADGAPLTLVERRRDEVTILLERLEAEWEAADNETQPRVAELQNQAEALLEALDGWV